MCIRVRLCACVNEIYCLQIYVIKQSCLETLYISDASPDKETDMWIDGKKDGRIDK